MNDKRILTAGIVGSAIAFLCCFTPVAFVLLAALGLSAFAGYLDYVLLPALAIFMLMVLYGIWQRQKRLAST